MAANIKGTENVINHIASFTNVAKVEILEKETSKHVISFCTIVNGDILENVKKFLTVRESEQNAENWFCKVYLKGTNTKSAEGKDYVGFSFQICEKQKFAVNGTINHSNNQMQDHKEAISMYVELGYLKAENKRLHNENLALQAEIDELSSELNESEINGLEDPMAKYKQYAELAGAFMPVLSALGFAPAGAANVVNGHEDIELHSIVTELQAVDKNLKQNLFKLLKLAKEKPAMYNMAVGYLNQL
jgi:molecular chaperone GrpE (heat shock protein)